MFGIDFFKFSYISFIYNEECAGCHGILIQVWRLNTEKNE